MTMRMVIVAATTTLVAGVAAATLGGTPALVFAAVLVVLMAWALPSFLHWRSALRPRVITDLAAGPARRRAPEARRN